MGRLPRGLGAPKGLASPSVPSTMGLSVNRAIVLGIVVALASLGCAGTPPPSPRRLFAEAGPAIPREARGFVIDTQGVFRTPTGSWTEPLVIAGRVHSFHRRAFASAGFSASARGDRYELVVQGSAGRTALRFDMPVDRAPIRVGQWVRVEALATADGPRLASRMAVFDDQGRLLLAGFHASALHPELEIAGWSFALGPSVQRALVCGGIVEQRAIRVVGPGGEVVLWPGYRSLAPLGASGERYAIDVLAARTSHRRCEEALRLEEISFVVRRVESPDPGPILAAASAPR